MVRYEIYNVGGIGIGGYRWESCKIDLLGGKDKLKIVKVSLGKWI